MYSPLCSPFQRLYSSRILFDGIIPLFHVFTRYFVHPTVFWECLVQVSYSVWVGGIEIFFESQSLELGVVVCQSYLSAVVSIRATVNLHGLG
jgi:hypothetical protein